MKPEKAILDIFETEVLKDTEITESDIYDMQDEEDLEFEDIDD